MGSKPYRAIKPMFQHKSSWKLRVGDMVQVMTGKDRGKQGEVLSVIRDQRFPRVIVSGINMVTRHMRLQTAPTGEHISGYSVKYEAPIHYSNVMLLDPETKKPVRVRFGYEDKEPYNKVRISRGRHASGCIIPWPDQEPAKVDYTVGDKDTRPEDAEAVSYNPAADFNLEVPSAHRRLRALQEAREAAAVQQKQRQQQRQPTRALSRSSSRGYCTAALCVDDLQERIGWCSLAGDSSSGEQQNRIAKSFSSVTSRLLGNSSSSSRHYSSWCGLAAAPYLL